MMCSSAVDDLRATKNNLATDEIILILDDLLKFFKAEIPHGTVKDVAEDHGLDRRQISNIWKRYKDSKKKSNSLI